MEMRTWRCEFHVFNLFFEFKVAQKIRWGEYRVSTLHAALGSPFMSLWIMGEMTAKISVPNFYGVLRFKGTVAIHSCSLKSCHQTYLSDPLSLTSICCQNLSFFSAHVTCTDVNIPVWSWTWSTSKMMVLPDLAAPFSSSNTIWIAHWPICPTWPNPNKSCNKKSFLFKDNFWSSCLQGEDGG